jgi:hypothetical protein
VTDDITRGIIRKIHDAFIQGDHVLFGSYYYDDIDWTFHAPVSVFPFLGRRVGKAAVFLSLRDLYAGYKIEGLAAQIVLADGDPRGCDLGGRPDAARKRPHHSLPGGQLLSTAR